MANGKWLKPAWKLWQQCLLAVSAAISAASAQPIELEGLVTFAGLTPGKIVFEVTAGQRRITAELPDDSPISVPLLMQSRVRIRGSAGQASTADGYSVPSRLQLGSADQLVILEPASRHWEAWPVTSITQTRSLRGVRGELVRLQGAQTQNGDPRKVLLRDDTGEIKVELVQPMVEPGWGVIEVLGEIHREPAGSMIKGAIWRKLNPAASEMSQGPSLLVTTESVHALTPGEAKASFPVRIRGVVTSRDPNGGMVQDAARGVYVLGLEQNPGQPPIKSGDYIEVEGVTARGTFAPMIRSTRVVNLGAGIFPDPVKPSWERLNNGTLDCQYVEIEGFVTEAYEVSLVLLMPEGHFGVALVPDAGLDFKSYHLPQYLRKHVRIRGTVFVTRNNETGQVRAGSFGLGNAIFGFGDPIVTLEKQIAELSQFDARAAGFHRVKVTGQVLYAGEKEYYLSDGIDAVRFVTRDDPGLVSGDRVEVIGFPRLAGSSPVLLETLVTKRGHQSLPAGRKFVPEELAAASIGTLVQLESRLLGTRTNRNEIILDLQAGSRSLSARLNRKKGEFTPIPSGSLLLLTGVYTGAGADRITGQQSDSSELLLNSPQSIEVLERPSWWTPARALTVSSLLMGALLLGAGWVISLRRQVEGRTRELKKQIEQRQKMQAEIEQVHKKLVDASRKAGMAQIATGVLHNVGNVLNSVNVSANILTENTRNSRIPSLTQLANLLEEHSPDLPRFMASDPRGQRIPRLLRNLEGHFRQEQAQQLQELDELKKHLDHMKETVAMQQSYAKNSTVYENVSLLEVIEDALKLQEGEFARHEITLSRDYDNVPPFYLDRHKVLQIVINLLTNARAACHEKPAGPRKVQVRVKGPSGGQVRVEVEDSGAGIAPENLQKIFSYGFTTRARGHGYGLHSSANAASEMHSSLSGHSEGPGKGATFVLSLPFLEHLTPAPEATPPLASHAPV